MPSLNTADRRADPDRILVTTPCPGCGTPATVPGDDRSVGSAQHVCDACGYTWRWLVPGQDAFSLILAHEIRATAPVEDEHEPVRGVFRAARFVVRLPLRYCVVGGDTWGVGMTENISRSGILFRTDPPPTMRQALTAKPALDMTLKLPQEDVARPPLHVHSQGGVVRATWSDRRGRPSAWAITVGDYILQTH